MISVFILIAGIVRCGAWTFFDRRDIILLSYFLDMSDAEIANVLNMVRRSVAYRRTSTLKLLKNLMGGENR